MKKLTNKIKGFFKSEQGDFGVKEIAIMVAIIVIVGFAITVIQGKLSGWIDTIWKMAVDAISDFI